MHFRYRPQSVSDQNICVTVCKGSVSQIERQQAFLVKPFLPIYFFISNHSEFALQNIKQKRKENIADMKDYFQIR